jgi:hypothetical protein
MRLLLGLVVVTACGTEEGALLTVRAPDGPGAAARLEIVLASASSIDDVDQQRVAPTDLDQETARYYRQRSTAGDLGAIATLDGFQLRLEPDIDKVPEPRLVPLLIAYDDAGAVIGIGARLDDSGKPAEIEIEAGQLLGYDIAMLPIHETDGADGVMAGELVRVQCNATDSGLAWQPGGTQVRLLLAQAGNDASERALDMDCDGFEAIDTDCDDLRSEFHRGATEECDGKDYDCDFRRQELIACEVNGTTCGATEGVLLCTDSPGNATATTCVETAECACEGTSCQGCLLPFGAVDGGPNNLCEPYVTDLPVFGCEGGCKVEVVQQAGNPWRLEVSVDGINFSEKVTGVVDKVHVQLFDDQADSIDASAGEVVGAFYYAVTPTTTPGPSTIQSWALRLDSQGSGCTTGPKTMSCFSP